MGYRPLPDSTSARALFDYAAIPWPGTVALAWGAWLPAAPSGEAAPPSGERLVAAALGSRQGTDGLLHGPVVRTDDGPDDPLEVAGQLVTAALDHATALGISTVFARPQGLDRVWVRLGFIPVPEVALPAGLAERRGGGLYAWRGGSALWTLRETSPPA